MASVHHHSNIYNHQKKSIEKYIPKWLTLEMLEIIERIQLRTTRSQIYSIVLPQEFLLNLNIMSSMYDARGVRLPTLV